MATFICIYTEPVCTLHFLCSDQVQLELGCVCRAWGYYRQNDTALLESLSLALVDRHRQCWSYWEMSSLQSKRKIAVWWCIVKRVVYIIRPLEVPLIFPAVMSVAHTATIAYLAPLQCPLEILRFLNNITDAPIFMLILRCGRRLKCSELRSSGV